MRLSREFVQASLLYGRLTKTELEVLVAVWCIVRGRGLVFAPVGDRHIRRWLPTRDLSTIRKALRQLSTPGGEIYDERDGHGMLEADRSAKPYRYRLELDHTLWGWEPGRLDLVRELLDIESKPLLSPLWYTDAEVLSRRTLALGRKSDRAKHWPSVGSHDPLWSTWCRAYQDVLDNGHHPLVISRVSSWAVDVGHLVRDIHLPTTLRERFAELRASWMITRRRTFL